MDEIEYDWAIMLAQLWDDPSRDNFDCGWDWKNDYGNERDTHDNPRDNCGIGNTSGRHERDAEKRTNRGDKR